VVPDLSKMDYLKIHQFLKNHVNELNSLLAATGHIPFSKSDIKKQIKLYSPIIEKIEAAYPQLRQY
jgi:hypothetical protein